ncbi:MAG: RHS repeat-associated core domain-containing protein [Lentimicrobiaceae bacterium]|nr:RHS repeat-associated core domain-containing protein [Lentimicrobiaceae bacterium]
MIIFANQTTKTINYITSPEGLTAIEITANPGEREWYWVFTDHLGSITTLLRESDGQKFEMSFDAWGNRRDSATWENYTTTFPDFVIDRGFTGHEHLDVFGLINMNGRVYDPQTARFLSPDVVVADPGNPAGYNPYAYVLNNPLKYTDPSGYEPFTIAAYVIAAIIIYSNSARANGNPATGSYEWDFTKWFSKDKPGFGGIGLLTNSSFTNRTYFVSINPTNGGGGVLGYNTRNGWGSGSSPQNMYFPNHNAGASEAAAVNSIARMDRSISDIGPTNYMDILLTRIKGISQFIDLPPLHIVWTGEYGSGSIIGGVPEWWGGGDPKFWEWFSDGVWTLGLTGTLSAGIIGGSFELGITMDFRTGINFGTYGTLEHSVGADLSLGGILNYHKPTNGKVNFSINSLYGWGESSNGGAWIIDGTYGGDALNKGFAFNDYSKVHPSYQTYGFGLSVGLPLGYSINKGKTWVSPTIKLW